MQSWLDYDCVLFPRDRLQHRSPWQRHQQKLHIPQGYTSPQNQFASYEDHFHKTSKAHRSHSTAVILTPCTATPNMDERFLDLDDAGSCHLSQDSQTSAVGSNLSQEGDPSSAAASPTKSSPDKKKKKRRSKKEKTKKHSPREGADSVEGDADSTHKRSKKSSKHKDDKNEKKARKQSSRRPEPEGGNPLPNSDSSALEYDRIINNSDPIFSDIDLAPSDEESKPKRPPRARQNRAGPSVDVFIPCGQLGINSNTMIKYAIIGTELKNIIQVSNRLESETARLHRRLQLLDEDIGRSDERMATASKTLEEASKVAEKREKEREDVEKHRRSVERQRSSIERKIGPLANAHKAEKQAEELETFFKQAAEVAKEAEVRYDKAIRRLVVIETEIDKAEAKSKTAEMKVKQLEDEVHALTSSLRAFSEEKSFIKGDNNIDDDVFKGDKCSQTKSIINNNNNTDPFADMTQQLKAAESKAELSEKEVDALQKTIERMEYYLEHACDQTVQFV